MQRFERRTTMFCEYCGREIEEGESCSCEEAKKTLAVQEETPAQVPAVPQKQPIQIVADAFVGVPGVMKKWFSDTQQKNIPISTNIVLCLGEIIAHVLSWILLAATLTDAIDSRLRGINGTATWCGLLTGATALLVGFLIPVVGQLLKKERIAWKENFAASVSVALLPAVLFLIGALLCLVSFQIGILVIVLAVMVGIVECCRQTRSMLFDSPGVLATLMCAVIPALVAVMVGNVVCEVLLGYVEEIIKSLILGSLW